MSDKFVINTDGGSRGNPGPAACSFVVKKDNKLIHEDSKFLGKVTNNFAEYSGVLLALEWVEEKSEINFFLDSELVVKQLNGLYKVKNETMKMLYSKILSVIKSKKLVVNFHNIPRAKNEEADFLVNKKLDESN